MLRQLVPSLAALLGIAACGEVKTLQPVDSPPVKIDGPPGIDAPHRGSATVKLLDFSGQGSAVTGAQVVFTDAFETQRSATDGSGFATAEIADDATVTVVAPDGNEVLLQTVYHVKIGDQITLGVPSDIGSNLGSFTVNFIPVQGLGSATPTSYTVFGPCGGAGVAEAANATSGAVTLSFESTCKQDPMELLLVARNGQTGASLGYIDKTGVSFVAGGSTTLSGTYQPFIDFTADVTNGSALEDVDIERVVPDRFGFATGVGATVTAGSATLAMSGPNTATGLVEIDMERGDGFGEQELIGKIDGSVSTFAFDVGSNALPWLGAPTLDVPSGTIHVPVATDDSSPADPTMFFALMEYQRPAAPDGGVATEVEWFLFSDAPGDLVLPTLPPDVTSFTPLGSDDFQFLEVETLANDGVTADQARAAPFAILDSGNAALPTRDRSAFNEGAAGFADGSGSGSGSMIRAGSRGHWSPPRVRHGAARAH